MSIIVPPEINRMIAKANASTIQKAAARAVKATAPGGFRPPRFGSLVGKVSRTTAAGWQAGMTGEMAFGAEYGGRRRAKVTYLRNGRAVRRRTTQQFLPYNSRGYALTPATRRSMAGIRNKIVEAVIKAVL